MRRIIASSLLLGLALAGCGSDKPVEPIEQEEIPLAGISGRIYHRFLPEEPLAGAVLSWGDSTTTSDADGDYALSELSPGADSLRVSLDGYFPESRWIELSGDDARVSFALLPLDLEPPPPPLGFSVSSEDGEFFRLSWQAPAEMDDVSAFWLLKSPGDPQSQSFPPDVTSWLDISIAASREYTYSLSTRDAAGNLSEPLVRTVVLDELPSIPVLVAPVGSDYSSIPLAWSMNQDEDFAAYRLFRAGDAPVDSLDLLVYESEDPLVTNFIDESVSANAVYYYRLYVYDQAGQVSTHVQPVPAAAQIFIAAFNGVKRAVPLPGTGEFLYFNRDIQGLHRADADGNTLASLDLTLPVAHWRLVDGGARAWGAYRFGYLAQVRTDPLELISESSIESYADGIVPLGGDSLLLMPLQTGPAVIYDGASFSLLGNLDAVGDVYAGCLGVADTLSRRLYLAEPGGERRLMRVDYSAAPVLEETVSRELLPLDLHYRSGDPLRLAYQYSNVHENFDPLDFTQVELVQREGANANDRGAFSGDGAQFWQQDYQSASISAYDSDTGALLMAFDQIAAPYAPAPLWQGSRVVVPLSQDRLSICDSARGDD